ncbi:MAG TPA: LuxR C-terminal-related transcriptional regulator [Chloroflexia bacterium]|nr:LuxR C-terminal-related transcriptional regulator [Chloroflexia bacterium]
MASQVDLLLTKIRIPRSRSDSVLRPRLNSLVEKGLSRKLTLICAPPGSGKTTLIAEWRATTVGSSFPLAWFSLDENDNDPVRFWRYLITALRTLAPVLGEEALEALATPQTPPVEAVINSLINSVLEELDNDFALVLDDYHSIKQPEIQAGLAYLLGHMPSHMHLVITSRSEPQELPLSRLRVRRELVEIRSEDLRFTREEAAAFLEKILNRPLGNSEIELLENRTEGWAAGLQLAALSLQEHSDPATFMHTFGGSDRLVLDFLADEVFYHQSELIQRFLLHTAILRQLNEELAKALTGEAQSREMLEKLDRDNLFLTSLDNNRQWYRYHPLFAEFLISLLTRTEPEMLPELHRRAAAWYEAHGLGVEALTHSLEARDYSKVVELLFALVLPLVHQGESVTVMSWFEALPQEILRQNPRLNTLLASALLVTNHFDEMDAPLNLAESLLQQQGDERGLVDNQSLRSHLLLVRGEIAASKALAQKALELASIENNLVQATANVAIGSAYLLDGALTEAEGWLNKGWGSWAELQTRNMLAEVEFLRGNLKQAEQHSKALLELNSRNTWQEGVARVRLGRLNYEWNRLEEAHFWLDQAISHSQGYPQSAYLPGAYLALARLEWTEEKKASAFEALRQAGEAARRLKNYSLVATTEAWENYFKLFDGKLENVWKWLETQNIEFTSPDSLSYQYERHYLTIIQALLASDQPEAALAKLEWLSEFARKQGRVADLIEILGLKALTLEKVGQSEAALASLFESVQLATHGEFLRVYLNLGRPWQNLLARLRMKYPDFEFLEKLLAAFDKPASQENRQIHLSEGPQAFSYPASANLLIEPLSERELEVLRLIEEGISNKAIADRLYLSLATVKTHINHLYAKLGVENRVQALAQARALNLI